MKRAFSTLLLLPLLLTACGQGSSSDQIPANAQKVNVVASDWKWTLDKQTFKVGVPIDFHIVSSQGIHGFKLVGTDIAGVTLSEGKSAVDKVWTPDKPGTYTISCDQYCGSGHANMFTQFTVQ